MIVIIFVAAMHKHDNRYIQQFSIFQQCLREVIFLLNYCFNFKTCFNSFSDNYWLYIWFQFNHFILYQISFLLLILFKLVVESSLEFTFKTQFNSLNSLLKFDSNSTQVYFEKNSLRTWKQYYMSRLSIKKNTTSWRYIFSLTSFLLNLCFKVFFSCIIHLHYFWQSSFLIMSIFSNNVNRQFSSLIKSNHDNTLHEFFSDLFQFSQFVNQSTQSSFVFNIFCRNKQHELQKTVTAISRDCFILHIKSLKYIS